MEKKNNSIKGILKYISKVISYVILTIVIICGLFLLFVFISAKVATKNGKTPPINLYTIISPSMTPNINVYDVVVTVKTDPAKLKVGDVISFYTNEVMVNGLTITHRIYNISNSGEEVVYKTKGDFNKYVDKWTVRQGDIVGKVYFKIPQLGRVQFFLGSKGGWLIAILIPALAIISYDIYKIIKLIFIRQKIVAIQKEEDLKENVNKTVSSITDLYTPTENRVPNNNVNQTLNNDYNSQMNQTVTHDSSQVVNNNYTNQTLNDDYNNQVINIDDKSGE